MSNTVDNRVVSLDFDNAKFEKNVATSMSTLDKLKEKLSFKGATKGLEDVERASSKVDMSHLGNAVEKVQVKFSALEAVAVGALMNIANRAVDAGTKLVKSLSIDQVTEGMSKYEKKTESVQTIMNSTGKSLKTVSAELEKINWFTDETSYNFTDMVDNVGKFTNANIELSDAVDAMQGIATWAGLSGANAQQASRVMYNISQAMGMGSLQRMDWVSIENAQMATMGFKEALVETGVELGRLQKLDNGLYRSLVGNTDDFDVAGLRNSLTEGKWVDNEVLTAVLKKYGSFATKLQEATEDLGLEVADIKPLLNDYIKGTLDIGDAAEEAGVPAKKLSKILKELGKDEYQLGREAFYASQISKTFTDSVNYTKDAVSTGWMNTFEYIFGNFNQATKLWSKFSDEFLYDIFVDPGNKRNEVLKKWNKNGGRAAFIEGLWNGLNAIKDMVELVREAFSEIFPPITAKKLKELTKGFRDFTEKFKMTDETAEKVKNTFKGLFSVLKFAWEIIKAGAIMLQPFVDLLKSAWNWLLSVTGKYGLLFTDFTNGLSKADTLKEKAQKIADYLYDIPKRLGKLFEDITGMKFTDAMTKLGDGISEFFAKIRDAFAKLRGVDTGGTKALKENLDGVKSVYDFFKSLGTRVWGFLKRTGAKIGEIFDFVVSYVSESETAKKGIARIKELFDKLKSFDFSGAERKAGKAETFIDKVKGVFDKVKDFFTGIKDVVKGQAKASFDKFSDFFGDVKQRISEFDPNNLLIWAQQFKRTIDSVVKILNAIAGVSLTWALRNFVVNMSGLTKSVKGVVDNIKTATGKLKGDSQLSGFQGFAKGIENIGIGIALISGSIWLISKIDDPEKLWRAVKIVGGIFAAMAAFALIFQMFSRGTNKVIDKDGKIKSTIFSDGNALKRLGIQILLMSVGVAIISASLAALTKLEHPENLMKAAGSLAIVLGVIGAIAAAISIFGGKFGDQKGSFLKTTLLVLAMCAGVWILSKAIKELAGLPNLYKVQQAAEILLYMGIFVSAIFGVAGLISGLTKGIGALGIVAAAAGLVAAGFAIMEVAWAIRDMTPALESLGKMKTDELAKALSALRDILKYMALASAALAFVPSAPLGAAAFIEIAIAIKELADPLSYLYWMIDYDWDVMKRTLLAFLGVLSSLAGNSWVLSLSPFAGLGSKGLIDLVEAFGLIVSPLASLAALDPTQLDQLAKSVPIARDILNTIARATAELGYSEVSDSKLDALPAIVQAFSDTIEPLGRLHLARVKDPKGIDKTIKSFRTIVDVLAGAASTKYDNATGQSIRDIVDSLKDMPDLLVQFAMINTDAMSTSTERIETLLNTLGSAADNTGINWWSERGATALKDASEALKNIPGPIKEIAGLKSEEIKYGVAALSFVLTELKKALNFTGDDEHPFLSFLDGLTGGYNDRATAISTLADALPKLTDSVKTLSELNTDKVGEVLTALGTAFHDFGEALETGFAVKAGTELSPTGAIRSVFGIGWTSKSKKSAEGIGALIDNIADLTAVLPPFMTAIGKDPDLAERSLKMIGQGFKDFGTAVEGSIWTTATAQNKASAIGMLTENIQTLTAVLPGFLDLMYGEGYSVPDTPMVTIDNSKGNGLQTFMDSMSGIVSMFGITTKDIDNTIAAFTDSGSDMQNIMEQTTSQPAKILKTNAGQVQNGITVITGAFQDLATAITELNWTINSEGKANALNIMGGAISSFTAGMKDYMAAGFDGEKFKTDASNLGEAFKSIGGALKSFPNEGGAQQAANFERMANGMPNMSKGLVELIPLLIDMKDKDAAGQITAVAAELETFKSALEGLDDFDFDYDSLNKMFKTVGTDLLGYIEQGLWAGTKSLNSSINAILETTTSQVIKSPANRNKFYLAGKFLLEGLAEGMTGEIRTLIKKSEDISNGIYDRFVVTNGISSPAKRYVPIGRYLDLGLVAGLEEYAYKVNTASEGVAEDAIAAANKPFTDSGLFGDDPALTMTITPVLDLSEIQNGARSINDTLNAGNPIDVSLASRMARQTAYNMNDRSTLGKPDGSGRIVNEIAALRGDLAECRQAIGQMQIRMDTGALVGSIAAPLDTALGKRAIRNGRGVR